jgi:NAD(P)-dependent dehydrogenase (short-subunit alcohol dehydrogenase family)
MHDVAGKVAFISGGSSGIGLAIARALADAGMKIVVGYRTKEHLDEAMKYLDGAGSRVHALNVDVTDRAAMENAAAETVKIFGKVHVVVNTAGVSIESPLSEMTYNDWDWLVGINLNGVFNGVHAFLPRIQEHNEGGQIITTSSILGLFTTGSFGAYSATKFAVVGMMEALRAELADAKIGVSVFCPGPVKSNIADSSRNRPNILNEKDFAKNAAEPKAKTSKFGSDTLIAGQLVLRGMRNNDLYILMHPHFERQIQERNEAIIASNLTDAEAARLKISHANSVLKTSVYTNERDRRLCARSKRA